MTLRSKPNSIEISLNVEPRSFHLVRYNHWQNALENRKVQRLTLSLFSVLTMLREIRCLVNPKMQQLWAFAQWIRVSEI